MTYRRFTADCLEDGRRDVECHELSTPEARLQWEVLTGEVVWIGVNADSQRQGIATALWHAAGAYGEIHHSSWRSDSGDAFARSVGGFLPERSRV